MRDPNFINRKLDFKVNIELNYKYSTLESKKEITVYTEKASKTSNLLGLINSNKFKNEEFILIDNPLIPKDGIRLKNEFDFKKHSIRKKIGPSTFYTITQETTTYYAYTSNEVSGPNGEFNEKIIIYYESPVIINVFGLETGKNTIKEGQVNFYRSERDFLASAPFLTQKLENIGEKHSFTLQRQSASFIELKIFKVKFKGKAFELFNFNTPTMVDIDAHYITDFRVHQELQGGVVPFISGYERKQLNLSFIDPQGAFDPDNKNSPYIINPFSIKKISLFAIINGQGFPMGSYYTASTFDYSNKKVSIKALSILEFFKKKIIDKKYIISDNLYNLLSSLFSLFFKREDFFIDPILKETKIERMFYGGVSFGSTLKTLIASYGLLIYENMRGVIEIKTSYVNHNIKMNISSYVYSNLDTQVKNESIINKVINKKVAYKIKEDNIAKKYIKGLLPSPLIWYNFENKKSEKIFDDNKILKVEGAIRDYTIIKDNHELTTSISLVEMARKKPHWIKRMKRKELKKDIPSLEYNVLLDYSLESINGSGYVEKALFKRPSGENEALINYFYFEFTTKKASLDLDKLEEETTYDKTLISIKLWIYETICFNQIDYLKDNFNNHMWDNNGYARYKDDNREKAISYFTQDDSSIIYGAVNVIPKAEEIENIVVNKQQVDIKTTPSVPIINEYTKENLSKTYEIKASPLQIFDRKETTFKAPENSEDWLYIKEEFDRREKYKVSYINLSTSSKSYKVSIYGREYIKEIILEEIKQDANSIYHLEEHSITLENASDELVDTIIDNFSRPVKIYRFQLRYTPYLQVGDLILITDSGKQIKCKIFKLEHGFVSKKFLTIVEAYSKDFYLKTNSVGIFKVGSTLKSGFL